MGAQFHYCSDADQTQRDGTGKSTFLPLTRIQGFKSWRFTHTFPHPAGEVSSVLAS